MVTVTFMRIELPSPTWADLHRAQDDAHTLTLPAPRPVSRVESAWRAADDDGASLRVEVSTQQPAVALTLTL